MLGYRSRIARHGLLICALAGLTPVAAAPIDPGNETGPAGLARLQAAEKVTPGAAIELRIAQIYGPGPADIGPGGQKPGTRGPDGVMVDYPRAMVWLRRAAGRCHDGAASEAQFQIGDFYAYGAGVKRDKVQALTWYLIATDLGRSGLRGEYVDEMKSQTTRAERGEAASRAKNYLAAQRQRCGVS